MRGAWGDDDGRSWADRVLLFTGGVLETASPDTTRPGLLTPFGGLPRVRGSRIVKLNDFRSNLTKEKVAITASADFTYT